MLTCTNGRFRSHSAPSDWLSVVLLIRGIGGRVSGGAPDLAFPLHSRCRLLLAVAFRVCRARPLTRFGAPLRRLTLALTSCSLLVGLGEGVQQGVGELACRVALPHLDAQGSLDCRQGARGAPFEHAAKEL